LNIISIKEATIYIKIYMNKKDVLEEVEEEEEE
jgi:hypothetical protein